MSQAVTEKTAPAADEVEEIRLLSEGELYRQAVAFVAENRTVYQDTQINSQLNGLLNASRSWSHLNNFVDNQTSRVWVGKKEAYGTFYNNLKRQLEALASLARDQFINEEVLTNRQTREQTGVYAGLLAREFIQHLFAEMMWQKEVGQ